MRKKICQDILKLALPVILANLVNNVSGFICMVMMARLGYQALSAGALIYSVLGVVMMLAYALVIPVSILTGQAMGASNQQQVQSLFQAGIVLALMVSLPLLLVLLKIEQILLFLQQPTEIVSLAVHYFYAFSFGFLPLLLSFVISQWLIGIGQSSIHLIFTCLNSLFLILSTFVMIVWKKPSLFFGMAGAGYAHAMSYGLLFAGQFFYICIKYQAVMRIERSLKNLFLDVMRLVKMGLPICIQRTAEILALSVLTFFMGWLGERALAAQHIISQISVIFLIIPFGFLQAGSVLVGRAYGQRQFKLLRQYTVYMSTMSSFCTLLLAFVCWISPYSIVHWFVPASATDLMNLAIQLLELTAFIQIFDSIRNTTIGALRGLNDSLWPMGYSLFCLWLIALPVAYLLAFSFHLKELGINLGFLLGIFSGMILTLHRFQWIVRVREEIDIRRILS